MMPSFLLDVLLPIRIDKPFTYESEICFEQGQLVVVPFRGKEIVGVVWQSPSHTPYSGNVKSIIKKLDLPPLPLITLQFVAWVSEYTISPLGMVLKMVISSHVTDQKKTQKALMISHPIFSISSVLLSEDQKKASQSVTKAIQLSYFQPFLLDGVTGAGKTEVYLEAMAAAFEKKKQVLVLLPEIALTTQWLNRFERRFGCQPLQWHSSLTESVRRQTWQAVLKEEALIIVGARSALFLPFPNLGLIIVDEEHDASYKQEEQVIYHARDMAVVRAKLSNSPVILVSATPSLETVVNVQQNRYQRLELKHRHGGAVLPKIHLIDMRKEEKGWISPPLREAIEQTLQSKEQVMLFLNRRGYAPLTLCRSCGFRFQCPDCTSWLVEHKATNRLICHHCSYYQNLPEQCPECLLSETFIPCGPGVERIHESVTRLFPQARCAILTSDLVQSPKEMKTLVQQITNHDIDILIGTQILAKGHHFPLITLVGVIDADLGVNGGDLRACERTYQLLHQVAGRAGREQRPGRVLLQTFTPDHPVMQALTQQDRDQFLYLEQEQRQIYGMPPFGKLASLIISGLRKDQVQNVAIQLRKMAPNHPQLNILGPVPAPLSQLRGRHRWRMLVKAPKSISLQPILRKWLATAQLKRSVDVTVDIDPYSFL